MSVKIINTRRLQIFELNVFMLSQHGAIFDGVGYVDPEFGRRFTFNQAVEEFNTRHGDVVHGIDNPEVFACTKVKLLYSKKQKKIICTEHLVKPSPEFSEYAKEQGIEPIELLKKHIAVLQLQ